MQKFLILVGAGGRNPERNEPARSGSTAAATCHVNRTTAGPAAGVAIRPPQAEALDPARPVAAGAPWAPAQTHHGGFVHHFFHHNRAGQHAQSRRRHMS